MFSSLPGVLSDLITGMSPVYLLLGVLIGLIFGAVPGLGGSQVLALLLPVTLVMDDADALILLLSASSAASQGGAVSAILLNTPGTVANAASTFDGYELTKRGEGARALGAAASAGIFGSVVSILILIAILPIGRWLVLQFSYADYFALALFGLAAVAVVSTASSAVRALGSGLLGLCVATIGISVASGELRYTFGSAYLYDGLGLVPVLIGLFAVSEAVRLTGLGGRHVAPTGPGARRGAGAQAVSGLMSTLRNWSIALKASLIGTVVGIVPGVGSTVSNFLAYSWIARSVGEEGTFGKGDIRGVTAPEAANNAKEGGALLPTLIFGIPGSVETAILLGALTVHGLQPGPRMMLDAPDMVVLLLVVGVMGNTLASAGSFGLVPAVGALARMSARLLGILLMATALTGAYLTQSGQAADVVVAMLFGLVGFLMVKGGYSRVMFTIGFVLGPIMERSFFQTIQVSGGTALFTRPVTLVLLVLTAFLLALPAIRKLRGGSSANARQQAAEAAGRQPQEQAGADQANERAAKAWWEPTADGLTLAAFLFFFVGILGVQSTEGRLLPEVYSLLGIGFAAAALLPRLARLRRSRQRRAPVEVRAGARDLAVTATPSVSSETVTMRENEPAGATSETGHPLSRMSLERLFPVLAVLMGAVFCVVLWNGMLLWVSTLLLVVPLALVAKVRPVGMAIAAGGLAAAFWALSNLVLGLSL